MAPVVVRRTARDGNAAADRAGQPHILLIEDAPGIADFLTRGLHAMGYRVTQAANGSEGRRVAAQGGFALVVLDWNIPGEAGRVVLDALNLCFPEMPVIVASASEEASRYGSQNPSPTVRFVGKPFAMSDDVFTLIADLLSRRPGTSDGREGRTALPGNPDDNRKAT